jgi:hypothetical protein
MPQDALIAVVTDALSGQLQSTLPAEVSVSLGLPADARRKVEGIIVHLFRTSMPPTARSVPLLGNDGRRLRPEINLQLDYLLVARSHDRLQAHVWLGIALRSLLQSQIQQEESIRPLLSKPELFDSLLPASLSLHWKPLELPLQEQAAVWVAVGEKTMEAGSFWRVDATWQGRAQ